MNSFPEISIIIVSYNVRELLIKCIESVYKYVDPNISFEVIVVDNNSGDKSQNAVRERFDQVKLIENNYNAGFPAANNQALKIAKGDFIFLLNPDTEFIEDSISILKKYLLQNENVDVAAPLLLNSDMSIQKSIFRFPRISYIIAEMFYSEQLTKSKYYSEADLSTTFKIDSAAGAALLFRKRIIYKIGLLNEKLFWIEDIDFCKRVKLAGGSVFFVPLTKIIHHSGESAKKNYNVSISNQIINKIKFYKVYGNSIELFILYIISIINVLLRILLFAVLSPFSRIYYLKLRAYVYTLPRIFNATSGF